MKRVAVVAIVLAGLFGLDLLAARRLTGGHLHLPVPVDTVRSVCPGEPTAGRELISGVLVEHAGVPAGDRPCRAALHTPTDWMLNASPYPPFPSEYDRDAPPPAAGSAVVVSDGRQIQVTVFSGVADTTPSRFVPSARGDASHTYDHRPTYLFIHEAADSARPRLLFAAWSSREVGGLEGIREAAIALSLLLLEIAVAGLLIAAYRWRRR